MDEPSDIIGLVRNTDPVTSHEAARYADVNTLFDMYVYALWSLGKPSTTTEIADHYGMPRDSFSPRSVQLEDAGRIERVGRRPNETPDNSNVMLVFALLPGAFW
jgi:hypothetical protein